MASDGSQTTPHLLPPVVLTIVALTSLNLAVAYLIARASGLQGLQLPDVLVWLLAAVGIVAAAGAVAGWRRYVEQARAARTAAGPGPQVPPVT